MRKIRGYYTGQTDMHGNKFVQGEDGYYYKERNGSLTPTRETVEIQKRKERERQEAANKPGFFDGMESPSSILARNIAIAEAQAAARKEKRIERAKKATSATVSAGTMLYAAANIVGHKDSEGEASVRSKSEYEDMFNKLYGKK